MIVERVWITKKYLKIGVSKYPKSTHYWKGIFLFGIIPLFLSNYRTEYHTTVGM